MGKAPPAGPAGPCGARVVVVVARLSWSAVRAGDGGGDQGDVGVVEAAQDAGEVDGDVVVAEAGGDAQDGGLGGRAAVVGGVVTRAWLAWWRLPRTRARWTGMWWSPRLAAMRRTAASEGEQLSWRVSRAVMASSQSM